MCDSSLAINFASIPISIWADIPVLVTLSRRPSGYPQYLVDYLAAWQCRILLAVSCVRAIGRTRYPSPASFPSPHTCFLRSLLHTQPPLVRLQYLVAPRIYISCSSRLVISPVHPPSLDEPCHGGLTSPILNWVENIEMERIYIVGQ